MPKFVIERELPGAGKLSASELKGVSQKSCGVLSKMGPSIQWVESFVTDDKIYCVYIAPDAASIKKHAQEGGFPANRISQIRTMSFAAVIRVLLSGPSCRCQRSNPGASPIWIPISSRRFPAWDRTSR